MLLAGVATGLAVLLSRDGSDAGAVTGAVTRIETGPAHEIVHATVSVEGGTVVINNPESPLNGMKLDIPAGAYPAPIDLRITESPITGMHFEVEAEAITPLVHVNGAEEYAEGVMTLQIPVTVADDEVAMAFIYNAETGTLEGLPTVERTPTSLTVGTRHFSPFVVLRGKKVYLDGLDLPEDKTSAYLPGRDTWNIPNTGSIAAPGGFCRGMALSSAWYFVYQKRSSGEGLWKPEYENGLDASKKTPDFWQDDIWAVQLCSLVQNLPQTVDAGAIKDAWRAKLTKASFALNAFYDTAFALAANPGRPVLLGLYRDTQGASGHTLVCYGIKDHALKVADPNFSTMTDGTIEYRDGFLQKYETYDDLGAFVAKMPTLYQITYFDGLTSFYDLRELQRLWLAYEAGTLEDYKSTREGAKAAGTSAAQDSPFPEYTVEISEQDEKGTDLGTRDLDLEHGTQVGGRFVSFHLRDLDGELTVFRFGDLDSPIFNERIELQPGENLIGLYVEKRDGQRLWWAGFDWVTIRVPPENPEPNPLNYTRCRLGFTLAGVVWEKWHDGKSPGTEEPDEPAGWAFVATGIFAGNVFTGTWMDVRTLNRQWVPGMPLPGDTARRGLLTVTVDPDTHDIISFKLDNTIEDPDSNLGTGWDVMETLVGGHLKLVEEKPTSTGLYACWEEETDGGTPPAEFTYTVNQGTKPRDVDGLLDYNIHQVWLYLYQLP